VAASNPEALLVVILGATASGKTALSLKISQAFDGEIVNCDSVALYQEFDIGTAKPSLAQRTHAPHHLFDYIPPTAYMTAGEYAWQARNVLEQIKGRRHLPIVVGGTGLYLRALLEGLFPGPQRSEDLRERLRARNDQKGPGYVHHILRKVDPVAAYTIHANDLPKVIRAIEVCLASRNKMTELWKHGRDPIQGFRILRLGLNPERALLYERINARAKNMFEAGLVEETARLLARYGELAGPLSSLGYKQSVQLLRGEITREQAVMATQQAHRNYAKRQMTWFRREPDVLWLNGFGDDIKIQAQAIAVIRSPKSKE
jgi:tRNA dimethylallyltransferase